MRTIGISPLKKLESWHAFTTGQVRRFSELAQLAAVHEGLQDVLLNRLVAVRHGRHGRAEVCHGVGGLRDTEVADVVGRRLFDGAVAVVAADHGIRKVEIFNQRFELAAVPLGHLTAEDVREFCGLANRAIRIEQALAERVQRGTPVKDHVVRVLDLREEESMTARRPPLGRREERRKGPQPFLGTAVDVASGQAVGECLQAGGIAADRCRSGTHWTPGETESPPRACGW
jgi:hypothetical protein